MAVIIAKKITPLRWLHLIRFTAFSTFSSRRRLPFDIPLIYRYPPCLLPAPNYRPPWHADAIGAGWRSQTKGEKRRADWAKLASDQAAQGFHLPRGPFTSPAFQFKSNFLLCHTQVLCYFLP